MNLVGYVSDENYRAICDAVLEFENESGIVAVARSSASGAVFVDIAPGSYRVTLACRGFGSKRSRVMLEARKPIQFRLLSDLLYGYAWPKWVRAGETGEFHVHSPEQYRLSLWRYGQTKELIHHIGVIDEHGPRANARILPDCDFTQHGVEWNKHGFDPTVFRVVAPQRSGLYFFHAETPSRAFLSFPWVVAPSKPAAKVAVIASTNTWNAYNNFGGRSNYINSTALPQTPTVNARQDLLRYQGAEVTVWHPNDQAYSPLSFERPEPFNHIDREIHLTDPIQGRQACHLVETEWRLLGWLEREGFAYDLYSDHQLHSGVLDLDQYEVLIISTHPEYWSREAYFRAKQWVQERGGKLMYLGGNGIDCEIVFSDDGNSMKCRTHLPTPAGVPFKDATSHELRDCRFHRTVESPAKLLGVVFTDSGAMTGAPFEVIDGSHWVFAGCGLRRGMTFGAASLSERCPGGASGHETDKRTAQSPATAVALARGLNINDGGSEMVQISWPGGGEVFSVGSIAWNASILLDPAVSRITRNVLERFLKAK